MKIDFSGIAERETPEFKGGKKSVYLKTIEKNDVKFIMARVPKGASVGMHKHLFDSETIYVLSGRGKAMCDGSTEMLEAGSIHFCPREYSHTVTNEYDEDLVFFAVVPKQI